MLYKARPSAVQCCGGRGTGKGRDDCVCVSDDLSQYPSDTGSPVIRAGAGPGPGGGVSLVFGGKHGLMGV